MENKVLEGVRQLNGCKRNGLHGSSNICHGKNRLHGVDQDSHWDCSQHDGWVQVCSFELVVFATADTTVFPPVASVATVSAIETQTVDANIDDLPAATKKRLGRQR